MKQLIRFIGYIIIAILITIIGFIIYFNTGSTGKLNPISLVPNDAIFLIESENVSKTLADLNQPSYKNFIETIPDINEVINMLNDEKYSWINPILENKKATFSIHPSPSQKEEFLLIADIDNYSKINFIPQIASHFNKTISYKKINSLNVYSIKPKEDKQTLHFVIVQNLLICATSYRTIENSIHSLYKKEAIKPEQTMTRNSFSKKNLNIYINEDAFNNLDHLKKVFSYTDGLAFSALSLKSNEKDITFEGYTSYYDSIPSIYQTLKHLQPGSVHDEYIIPSDIHSYVNLNINDFNTLYNEYMSQLSEYDQIKYAVYAGGMKLTQSYLNIDMKKDIFNWMSGEISIVSLNKINQDASDNILVVIKTSDINLATKSLEKVAHKVNKGNMANFKPIEYKKHKINFLNISGFFKLILNNYLNTREKPYYTKMDDYILFSTSDKVLKYTIDAIEEGHTIKNNNDFKNVISSKQKKHYLSGLYNIPDKNNLHTNKYIYLELEPEADLLKTKIQFMIKE